MKRMELISDPRDGLANDCVSGDNPIQGRRLGGRDDVGLTVVMMDESRSKRKQAKVTASNVSTSLAPERYTRMASPSPDTDFNSRPCGGEDPRLCTYVSGPDRFSTRIAAALPPDWDEVPGSDLLANDGIL